MERVSAGCGEEPLPALKARNRPTSQQGLGVTLQENQPSGYTMDALLGNAGGDGPMMSDLPQP